ncbi:hypothetical protein L1887_10841 [Cichorium endivia]|nr:hypothetical protein L1887_10841 [Cichorium endivia]
MDLMRWTGNMGVDRRVNSTVAIGCVGPRTSRSCPHLKRYLFPHALFFRSNPLIALRRSFRIQFLISWWIRNLDQE